FYRRPDGDLPTRGLAAFEMVRRLFDLPHNREGVYDGIDAEMHLAAIAPGRNVVRGHEGGERAPGGMDCALYELALAAFTKRFHPAPLQTGPACRGVAIGVPRLGALPNGTNRCF